MSENVSIVGGVGVLRGIVTIGVGVATGIVLSQVALFVLEQVILRAVR
jgi:hypothetical protein